MHTTSPPKSSRTSMAPPPRRPSSSSSSSASGHDTAAAVDAIIAEASDLVALEHVAALNTAHLSDCALLPSDLEARFRKLKSFPATVPRTVPRLPRAPPEKNDVDISGGRNLDRSRTATVPPIESEVYRSTKPSGGGGQGFDFLEQDAPKKMNPRSKSDLGWTTSSAFSSGSSSSSPSPPKQRFCFGFSRKKAAAAAQRRKGKQDESVPELNVEALKEEQRKLKKALKQQEELTREAAKLVRQAKQASARMTTTVAVDELLSDLDEELK